MQSSESAFYEQRGDRFLSSELTRGPWDADSQHAGPPAALLARAIERCEWARGGAPAGHLVGRITLEVLRPVPIAPLRIEAGVVRAGRRVEMVEAALLAEDGEALVRARGWRLRAGEVELPVGLSSAEDGAAQRAGRPSGEPGRPAPPETLEPSSVFFPTGEEVGYHTAMEYRFERGGFDQIGPAVCWMRMRHALVAGEAPTPLQRVLVAADSGNGISSTLDFDRFLFINVDLTVHLQRMPAGEWVCLDSLTIPEPTGVGISDTMLFDESGPLGRANQTLLIDAR